MTAPGHGPVRRRSRGPRWLALAWFVAVGTASGVHAQDTSGPRQDATSATGPARTAPPVNATDIAPPFWVAGVVIAPPRRSALLVVLDDARRDVGVVTVREGESYGGYRLASVEPGRVVLEQNGTLFPVPVGRPYAGPRGVPDVTARPGSGPIFVPGPDRPTPDVEYTGPQVNRRGANAPSGDGGGSPPDPELQDFLQRVFGHPQLQRTIEEVRPSILQSPERARQDGQIPPQVTPR